jgi:hypothetical protein
VKVLSRGSLGVCGEYVWPERLCLLGGVKGSRIIYGAKKVTTKSSRGCSCDDSKRERGRELEWWGNNNGWGGAAWAATAHVMMTEAATK